MEANHIWYLPLLIIFHLAAGQIFDQACFEGCSCCVLEECTLTTQFNCNHGCKDGYYGAKCRTKCAEGCVRCVKNFWVNRVCDECVDGYYNNVGRQDCDGKCPDKCTTCTSYNVCTACKPGYSNFGAITNCSYVPPPCPDNCLDCDSNNDCTGCKDGYYITNTARDCSTTCPSPCTVCTSSTSCSRCEAEYYVEGSECKPCREGCTSCTSHNQCDGCKPGFTGSVCESCVAGMYGSLCNHKCPQNCTICTSESSCDSCVNGYYNGISSTGNGGAFYDCRFSCPNSCLTCSSYTSCTECKSQNFKGTACDRCIDGKHGTNCDINCHFNCIVCNRDTGNCTQCKSGYVGDSCIECEVGKHGNLCDRTCPEGCLNNKCARNTAYCTDGCKEPNFAGTQCDICVDGFYGTSCSSPCPENCFSKRCDRHSGVCVSCIENFMGDYCDNCMNGKYGDTCDKQCSTTCKDVTCDRSNGYCSPCDPGFYGHTCSETCSPYCSDDICNQINGSCSNECEDNYSGDRCCLKNNFCTTCSSNDECSKCVNGMFGQMCDSHCPENCDQTGCHKNTGNCYSCKGQHYGVKCNFTCPDGCLEMQKDKIRCSFNGGTCVNGCVTGYHGNMCDNPCSTNCVNSTCDQNNAVCLLGVNDKGGEQESGPPVAIIAGVCGGVAALIVIALVVFFLRRRKTKEFSRKADGVGTSNAPVSNQVEAPERIEKAKDSVKHPDEIRYNEESEEIADDEAVPIYVNKNANVVYGNLGDIRKIVAVADLQGYLKKTSPDEFQEQFQIFPTGLIKDHNDSRKPGNLPRNRYAGVYAYDENRVKLNGLPSDYINASYIDGHKKPKAYIASLGPTKAVMVEFKLFWHMVWQEKVEKIVVVTNLMEESKMKFEQYWPSVNSTDSYGTASVTTESEEVNAEYTVRMFSVKKGAESRTVSQVHFTAWPDKGVPDHVTSIVEFHNRIKSLKAELGGPLLVHCSAGIGRTGTYIALDILTEAGEESGEVDVFNCVMALRQQRVNMVQTSGQYVYLHKAVTHALTYDSKPIPSNKFQAFTANATDADFQQKIERLRATMEELDEEEKESKRKSKDLSKYNRNGADIPSSRYRPRLFLYQTMGDNDYINAVYVDGFRMKNCFIAAQTPLPDTVADFIKLMLQENCACVVNLEPETLQVKTIGHYLPPDNQTIKHGPFKLSTTKLISPDTYTIRELKVVVEGQREAKEALMYCFQFNKWPGKANAPSDPVAFLRFIKDIKDKTKEASKEDRPIITHCLSGAIKCGLFFAVHNAVEKMESEEQVSISNVMRQIRYRRRAAFPNKDQMAFCYSAVSEYLKSFDTYSNFDLRM